MGDKSIPKLRFPEFTDEWEQRKLGEIAGNVIGGGTPKTSVAEYWDGSIPWIQSSNVQENEMFEFEIPKSITQIGLDKSAAKLIPKNSIAVVTHVGVGKLVFVPFSYATSQDFTSLAELKTDAKFTCYSLYQRIQNDLHIVQGSAIKGITKEDLLTKEIMVPEIEEQKKIDKYFSTLDHLITLHQRKCYCLKKLRDGIIQKILSRELRFKRADGREFENWVTKELWEILTERKVSQTITEDAPLLSFTIEQGVIKPQDKKTNKRDFLIKDKETKKFALTEVDDIIYNPANLKYGAIHRNKLMRGVVSPIYAIFYTEQNPAFMEYVVKNPIFIKNSMKYLEGTVIKLMTLKPRDFLKLKVEIPASLEEQKIIADFLMKFDETIDAEQKRIETWKELKKGLLQQMFV